MSTQVKIPISDAFELTKARIVALGVDAAVEERRRVRYNEAVVAYNDWRSLPFFTRITTAAPDHPFVHEPDMSATRTRDYLEILLDAFTRHTEDTVTIDMSDFCLIYAKETIQ